MSSLRRPPFPKHAVLFGLGLFFALSLLFQFVDWDQQVAAYYFAQGWPGERWAWSQFFYRYGEAFAALAGAWGAFAFAYSFTAPKHRHWRGPGLYFSLLLLLGPGLLVNGLAKALTGRPRPFETVGLGGLWDFARPFHFGTPGQGLSFLSGHAASAWYWFALFWALPTRGWRWIGLGLTLVYGGLMAWARVSQGAHWLSDTLLCGAAIFTLAAALSPLLRWQPSRHFWRRPGLGWALGLGALAWLSLSHVRYEDRRYLIQRDENWPKRFAQERDLPCFEGVGLVPDGLAVDLSLSVSDASITFGAPPLSLEWLRPFSFSTRFQGQGLPGGRQDFALHCATPQPDKPWEFSAQEQVSGLWLNASGLAQLTLPATWELDLRLHAPKRTLTIGPLPEGRRIFLSRLPEGSAPPVGFTHSGASSWLRDGALPLISLDIQAHSVRFE